MLNVKKFKNQVGEDVYINLDAITYFKKWDNDCIYIDLGPSSIIIKGSIEDFCKVIESAIRRTTVMK